MSATAEPLPLRLSPLPGEALPSWLGRIGQRYDLSLIKLLSNAFGHDARMGFSSGGWLQPPRTLVETIAARTVISISAVRATTFAGWAGTLAKRRSADRWPLADKLEHVTDTIAICPRCLAGTAVPDVRKLWTLSFVAVCPVHRIVLTVACSSCNARPSLDGPPENLHRCRRCGALFVDGQPAHPLAAHWQARLLSALRSGWLAPAHIGPIHWRVLLGGVREIGEIGRLAGPHARARLAAMISESADVTLTPVNLGAMKALPPRERHDALLILGWLLEDWPARMLAVAEVIGVTRPRRTRTRAGSAIKAAVLRMPWRFARDLAWRAEGWDEPNRTAIQHPDYLMRLRRYLRSCGAIPDVALNLWEPRTLSRWERSPIVRDREARPEPMSRPEAYATVDYARATSIVRPSLATLAAMQPCTIKRFSG